MLGQLHEQLLRVAVSEIEAGRLQHQSLEADDTSGMGLEDLGRKLVNSLDPCLFTVPRYTESSGDKCSAGGSLMLYAVQRMSRDFFNVSSILHAVNRAAAAASFLKSQDFVNTLN